VQFSDTQHSYVAKLTGIGPSPEHTQCTVSCMTLGKGRFCFT